ncbi:hypothetical protein [Massilia aerilata]|uniref:Uncharacterized protein n=1 Tax=Massilia aerilata TaxID=453817 RepID=A0ABW0S030_9BURK
MSTSFTAIRADHVGGHVAMAPVPYFPSWTVPIEARTRFQPWACTFHTGDDGPRPFVAFGGQAGMLDAVYALLGPLLLKMHGGLFETLAERVDFELDATPLQGARLASVAHALEAFISEPSFTVDCYLVGVDPHNARLQLAAMQMAIESYRSIVL